MIVAHYLKFFQLLGRTPLHVEMPSSGDEESDELRAELEVDTTMLGTEGGKAFSKAGCVSGNLKISHS